MIACDDALYVHAIHVCKHKVSSLTTHRKQHEYIFSYKVVTSTFLCLGVACFSSVSLLLSLDLRSLLCFCSYFGGCIFKVIPVLVLLSLG